MAPKKGKKAGKGDKSKKIKVRLPKKPPKKEVEEEEEEEEEEEDDEEEEEEFTDEFEEEEEEEVEEEEEAVDETYNRRLTPHEFRAYRLDRASLPDIEGAIPKAVLRKLTNKNLRQLIIHARKEIERFETENFMFERSIEKLERPEKAIDDMYPSDDSLLNMRLHSGPAICSSESEEEQEDTGEYVAINPIDEIHMSTDSFFENMSDNSKDAAMGYFKNIGEIAPSNYDVIRHKYGDLVKGAPEEDEGTSNEADTHIHLARSRLQSKVWRSKAIIDEKAAVPGASKPKTVGDTVTTLKKGLDLATMFEDILEDDTDYPGFSIATAKELKVEDKLRFALEEEQDFRAEYYKFETQALKEEGAVQIYVDAHRHAIKLLLTLRKDFKAMMKDAYHPLSGKLMAEMILRFKRKMRNHISAEDTKTRMTIRKIMSIKRRALHQLRTNKESGSSISQIDFEHLMTENQIFLDEMEEMNLSLKYLKQLSGHFFQILKEDQESVERLNHEDLRLAKEIETKKKVMKNFEKTYIKYRTQIIETNARMDDLKRKLSEYHAPQPLEYIRLKAVQYEMESDVAGLKKKLDEINLSLITARSTFALYCRMLPNGDQTEFDNERWLDDIKREVEENDLMRLLDEEDETDDGDVPDVLKLRPSLDKRSDTTKVERVRTNQILQGPTRATARRRSQKGPIYDHDFEFELSGPIAEASSIT